MKEDFQPPQRNGVNFTQCVLEESTPGRRGELISSWWNPALQDASGMFHRIN